MIDAQLLALLVCPDTHQDVILAAPEDVARINTAIREGRVHNVGGKLVDQPVQGALIRADQTIAYPIRDGIPVMLVQEGLHIDPAASERTNGA
jgi:uncharacterized protein YbaR (Trm112 family)